MKIQYLKKLKDNPVRDPSEKEYRFEIKGISLNEIQHLEVLYNNGNQFPKALKELLFLGGSYCYIFDRGLNKTQQEMQEIFREDMRETERIISRPFYVIEQSNDQFLFVYLDEGDDPQIYEALPWDSSHVWVRNIGIETIKSFVELNIDIIKRERNPFVFLLKRKVLEWINLFRKYLQFFLREG